MRSVVESFVQKPGGDLELYYFLQLLPPFVLQATFQRSLPFTGRNTNKFRCKEVYGGFLPSLKL